MALDHIQVAYFIEQVGLSAASFGVTDSDVAIVGNALTELFNFKCSPAKTVVPSAGPVMQSVCAARDCPFDKHATCSKYPTMRGTSMPPKPVGDAFLPIGAKLSAPVSSASCPLELGSDFLFPNLIVPVSKQSSATAFGASFLGQVSPDMSSIFDFSFPADFKGKTCNLVFGFPDQSQLVSSSYSLSGDGEIEFTQLEMPATIATTYDTKPAVKAPIMKIRLAPGKAYTLATYPCPSNVNIGIKARSVDTTLSYFQDFAECPIGLYITAS